MREAARALAEADRLIDKYGPDAQDGAVIRFRKVFLSPDSTRRPATPAEIVNSTFNPLVHREYLYAGIRADGLWYLTGGSSSSPQGVEWEDVLDFLETGVEVEMVEWLSHGITTVSIEAPVAQNENGDDPTALAGAIHGSHAAGHSASAVAGTGTKRVQVEDL